MKQQGLNDLPRTLTTTPYDLLRAIKRSAGGRDYQELQAALLRLHPPQQPGDPLTLVDDRDHHGMVTHAPRST